MTREEARLTLQENFGYLSEEHPRIIEAMKVAMNILSQPSLLPNMDEAAKEYLKQYNESEFGNGGDDWDDDILITFKAGAAWMAEQGETQEHFVIGHTEASHGIPVIVSFPETFEIGDNVIVQIRKR